MIKIAVGDRSSGRRIESRQEFAEYLEHNAIELDLRECKSEFEQVTETLKYLREHQDAVVRLNKPYWTKPCYYVYKKGAQVKTAEYYYIEEVDESQPWTVTSHYGYERLHYLIPKKDNEFVIDEDS